MEHQRLTNKAVSYTHIDVYKRQIHIKTPRGTVATE